MAANPSMHQYEPLRVPQNWSAEEKKLILQLTDIFDDIYRRYGRLRFEDMGDVFRNRIISDEGSISEIEQTAENILLEVGTDKVYRALSEAVLIAELGARVPAVEVAVNLVWYDTTNKLMKRCTAVGPPIVWEVLQTNEVHTSYIDIAQNSIDIGSTGEINIASGADLNIESGGKINIASADGIVLSSGNGLETTLGDYATLTVTDDKISTAVSTKADTSALENYSTITQTASEIALAVSTKLNANDPAAGVQTSKITIDSDSIDIVSGGNMNLETGTNLYVKSGADIDIASGGDIDVQSGGNMNVLSGGNLNIKSGGDIEIEGGADINVASTGKINIASGGALNLSSASQITIGTNPLSVGGTNLIPGTSSAYEHVSLGQWSTLLYEGYPPVNVGEYVTVRMYIDPTYTKSLSVLAYQFNSGAVATYYYGNIIPSTSEGYSKITLPWVTGYTGLRVYLANRSTSSVTVSNENIKELKAEKGVIATDWCESEGELHNSSITIDSAGIDIKSGGKLLLSAASQIEFVGGSSLDDYLSGASGASTFAGSSAPTATSIGDLWFDTGNFNVCKRWNGSSWVEYTQGKLSNSKLTLDATGISLLSGGTFTVASTNFMIDSSGNVSMKGAITATSGTIGDFTLSSGHLVHSNSGTHEFVDLSKWGLAIGEDASPPNYHFPFSVSSVFDANYGHLRCSYGRLGALDFSPDIVIVKTASTVYSGTRESKITLDPATSIVTAYGGFICKSPDGTAYKITVANGGGSVTITAV